MPKLRLSEVITEKSIIVDDLSADVQEAINTLLTRENTLGKIDKATAESLRLIAESLNVSIFDLFTPAEKFYRLKIFENLNEPKYLGSQKEKLEKLFAKLPSSSKISFNLLTIYATQVLPNNLLKGADLKEICKVLDVNLEDIKDIFNVSRQTISVESILLKLGITIDELSLLIEVPKKFIPWLSSELIQVSKISNPEAHEEETTTGFVVDPCGITFWCRHFDHCHKPCT